MALHFAQMIFTACELDDEGALLRYRLEGAGERVELAERFEMPAHDPSLRAHPAVRHALLGLHLAAGVSYYKTACPPSLVVQSGPLDALDAAYFDALYTHGLGEFFFRNELDPRGRVRFVANTEQPPTTAPSPPASDRVWVLVGGGKDSAVSTEAVRRAGLELELLSFGRPPAIERAAAASGLPYRSLKRTVDAGLMALNARGALNGHVPISAVLAHASLLAALLGGRSTVLSSNERSASEGNVVWLGLEVNHQWSKGLEFERALGAWWLRRVPEGPRYRSLLRPLSELHIASLFARHERYFAAVTSCNQNFRLDERGAAQRWCGRCPKCVFVYLVLRPFLSDAQRDTLFGRSFFADEANVPMVLALAGLGERKPFECVGTADEVCAALYLSHRAKLEERSPAMRCFAQTVAPTLHDPEALVRAAMTPSSEHCLSPAWLEVLDGELRAG